MCNTHPYFWTVLKKKKKAENRGCHFAKLTLKVMFWIHFKTAEVIAFSEISLNAQAIHETISSSNGLFGGQSL